MLRTLAIVALSTTVSSLRVGLPARVGAPRSRTLVAALTDAQGNEIKGAMSSYMHFCQSRRPALTVELKAQHGEAFKQALVMSGLGAEWKVLGDADKAKFAELAAADKVRYETAVASNPANANAPKRKRKSPAKSGPKKLSAYMHFCAERRPSLTAELKASMGATFKQPAVMTALGAEWKMVDAASKARFEEMAKIPVE